MLMLSVCGHSRHILICCDFFTVIFVYLQQVRFPAVTICNINMIRTDKVPESYIQEVLANISSNGNVDSVFLQLRDTIRSTFFVLFCFFFDFLHFLPVKSFINILFLRFSTLCLKQTPPPLQKISKQINVMLYLDFSIR